MDARAIYVLNSSSKWKQTNIQISKPVYLEPSDACLKYKLRILM